MEHDFERMGTGIERIRQAVTEHGNCTVEFIHTSFYTAVFRKKMGEQSDEKGYLQGSQKSSPMILTMLANNPQMTIAELSKALGIRRRAIKKHLASLKKEGKLKHIGTNRCGHWVVVEE
jgi:ATP-dependent DNA helicase RecG